MIIKLLRLLNTKSNCTLPKISQSINQSVIQTLGMIAQVNQIEPELIRSENGSFKLSRQINWLNQEQINSLLMTHEINHQIIILGETLSTNTYSLNNINSYSRPTIISCELQTSGRGRFGRKWLSKIATDLTSSLIYQLPANFNLSILPLIIAVAVNRLLKHYQVKNQIKWPNDIYSNGNKICGILVENVLRNQQNNVVIGIGLDNIGNWERNQLLANLVREVDNSLREYQLFGFPLLRREWLDNCIHYQTQITLTQDNQFLARGMHCDLSETGELVVKTAQGIQKFSSSTISLIMDSK